MSEWQPIETARKAEDILGACKGRVRIYFWRNAGARWGFYGAASKWAEEQLQPTHWMPLPEPPKP